MRTAPDLLVGAVRAFLGYRLPHDLPG